MRSLLGDPLDLSQFESGRMGLAMAPVTVAAPLPGAVSAAVLPVFPAAVRTGIPGEKPAKVEPAEAVK